MPIYLDNCATTCPFDQVVNVVLSAMKNTYENPSAPYRQGLFVEKLMDESRTHLARLCGVNHERMFFTSGGTEANITSLLRYGTKGGIITSLIEHPSVKSSIEDMKLYGRDVIYLPVTADGRINPQDLSDAMRPDISLVSIMHVNNEIGSVNDIEKLVMIAKNINPDVVFHSDGVQALGKIELAVQKWGVDLYSVSSHKIHGPKGVGGLYVSSSLNIAPLLIGGGQEKGMRSGTENVPGILGFGEAARIYFKNRVEFRETLKTLKKRFIEGICNIPDMRINSPKDGAPHIVSAAFKGVNGEALLHALEEKDILVNTGSACSSKKRRRSATLTALNIGDKYIDGTIRVSFSPLNSMDEIDIAIDCIKSSVKRLRMFQRR